jgi:hypothetical protein
MFTAFAGPVAAKPAKEPPGKSKSTEQSRTVSVMTRNLYLGAELTGIVNALTPPIDQTALVQAATATWNQVVDSDPEERMAAVADEIATTKPHAVGLQEVTEYKVYEPGSPTPTTRYDLLELLLDALEDRGLDYDEVSGATATNFTSAPVPFLENGLKFVQLQDRDVIIVRDDVTAANARNGNFVNVLQPPTFPIKVDRGWGSADLKVGDATFRFVNSHTEAFSPESMRVAQVNELLAAQAGIMPRLPTIYAGDYNSKAPSAQAYRTLARDGRHDLWVQAPQKGKPVAGYTCCQAADLRNQVSMLDERIDLLIGTRQVKAVRAERVGDEPITLPSGGKWASDHAGVVSVVVIPE